MFTKIKIYKLLREETATVAVFLAASILMLMLVLGVSIDFWRQENAREQLQMATKTSAFSASKTLASDCYNDYGLAPADCLAAPSTAIAVFNSHFQSFFDANYRSSSLSPTFSISLYSVSGTTITFQIIATMQVPTFFMGLVGINNMGVGYVTTISKNF
jgi:hypothetical protein